MERCSQLSEALANKVHTVIEMSFHSSSSESVDHDALWLALLHEVHQPAAHAPNCSVSDCERAERNETVIGRAFERVRFRSD